MFNANNASQLTKVAIFAAICFTIGWLALTIPRPISDNLEDAPMAMKTGGLGAPRAKDNEVEEAVRNVKPILEEKTNTKYDSIEIISYKPQLVAGMNYFVKVKAKSTDGVESFMHLRIYRDLRKNFELTQYQLDKTEGEEVKYFQ